MNNGESLNKKRKDLRTLIDHITKLEVDSENGPAMNCVLSRLMAEVRRSEVEEMRRHIMSCPGLSRDSAALKTALPALSEAMALIEERDRKYQMSLFGSLPGLAAASPQRTRDAEDTLSAASSRDSSSSFSSDLDDQMESVSGNSNTTAVAMGGTSEQGSSTKQKKPKAKKPSRKSSLIGLFFRSLFLDLPYASTVLLFVSFLSARHMYFTFYEPIMEIVQWTKTDVDTKYTNYKRDCDISDISTTNVDDLIVDPSSTTPEEALEITNKHGMSIFPNVVSEESAAEMRKWVLHRNANLSEDDEIPLISQEQRWSFPIGADEDPSVPPVLREIANNVMLQNSLDLIMNEDPAMVEFTAITSAYGAGDQHWHADNDFVGSQMHYARSFVPMYSLFIPLQDTTARMGATSACPGTHLCGNEDGLAEICDNLNFQIHDTRGRLAEKEEDHVWKTGDGYLMHLNTYHRGPGHTDPHGKERVMLIMSISNRPEGPHFDKRQISLGTSYSNKWDMWGMTMKDLAVIETTLGFPWKHLRTFGIWKPKGNHRSQNMKWGWDYITVACSRIMNDQMGFRYEDLEVFVKKMSKFGPIVEFLFGYLPEEGEFDEKSYSVDNGFRNYLRETSKRLVTAATIVYAVSCIFYILIGLVASGFRSTCSRFFKINAVIGLIFYGWVHYVSNTPWGKDIITGEAKKSPFRDRVLTTTTTTMPNKQDVLFSTRLHSPFLSGMNVIHDQQVGNAKLSSLVSQYSGAFSKSYDSPPDLQLSILQSISNEITQIGGRFLENDVNGDWVEPSKKETTTLVRRLLVAESNPITRGLYQEVKYLKSECYHGRMRDTVMMHSHSLSNLEHLSQLIFDIKLSDKTKMPSSNLRPRLHMPTKNEMRRKLKEKKSKASKYTPKKGDIVEYFYDGEGWFRGIIVSTQKRSRTLSIQFDDVDFNDQLSWKNVRPFKDYKQGERVIVQNIECTFVGIKAVGDAMVRLDAGDIHTVNVSQISRP